MPFGWLPRARSLHYWYCVALGTILECMMRQASSLLPRLMTGESVESEPMPAYLDLMLGPHWSGTVGECSLCRRPNVLHGAGLKKRDSDYPRVGVGGPMWSICGRCADSLRSLHRFAGGTSSQGVTLRLAVQEEGELLTASPAGAKAENGSIRSLRRMTPEMRDERVRRVQGYLKAFETLNHIGSRRARFRFLPIPAVADAPPTTRHEGEPVTVPAILAQVERFIRQPRIDQTAVDSETYDGLVDFAFELRRLPGGWREEIAWRAGAWFFEFWKVAALRARSEASVATRRFAAEVFVGMLDAVLKDKWDDTMLLIVTPRGHAHWLDDEEYDYVFRVRARNELYWLHFGLSG
jgi:hypothetical protein